MVKKLLLIFTIIVSLLLAFNWNLVKYGFRQAKGQLSIVWNTIPLDSALTDENFPDSLKQKIHLVEEIKEFCRDSLGLEVGENYQDLYNQNGKAILWVVTACPPYDLNPYKWNFPVIGEVSYKGFFSYELALEEEKMLIELGYDTDVDEVNAWSTLGWFKDPVLSSMLEDSPGQLARTLIHEITHYNLFVKDNVDYNENLASFIGDQGAKLFIAKKFGKDSKEMTQYLNFLYDLRLFSTYTTKKAHEIQEFYKNNRANSNLIIEKGFRIKQYKEGLLKLPFKTLGKAKKIIQRNSKMNNTFFTDFLTYRKNNSSMEKDFNKNFNSDIRDYIKAQKKTYGK